MFGPRKNCYPDSFLLMVETKKMTKRDLYLDLYEKIDVSNQIPDHGHNGH